MSKKEQPDYYYILDKILLALGVVTLIYRKGMSDGSLFYRIHVSPLLLTSICFGLSTFVFGEKIDRTTFDIRVLVPVMTLGATALAVWDQVKNFL